MNEVTAVSHTHGWPGGFGHRVARREAAWTEDDGREVHRKGVSSKATNRKEVQGTNRFRDFVDRLSKERTPSTHPCTQYREREVGRSDGTFTRHKNQSVMYREMTT